jgi:hypothetical protein
MKDQAKTQISDLRTVGVPVTDADRALEFYVAAARGRVTHRGHRCLPAAGLPASLTRPGCRA